MQKEFEDTKEIENYFDEARVFLNKKIGEGKFPSNPSYLDRIAVFMSFQKFVVQKKKAKINVNEGIGKPETTGANAELSQRAPEDEGSSIDGLGNVAGEIVKRGSGRPKKESNGE